MIMIVGGAFQGKTSFACGLTGWEETAFLDGASCGMEELYTAKGIRNFHLYIKRRLLQEPDLDGASLAEELYRRNPQLVIVSNELGYGIVPAEPQDRLWRETTGRTCTALAGKSSQVYRVVCGIAMPLLPVKKNSGCI